MITRMYAVYDRGTQAYNMPFACPNASVLLRSFKETAEVEMSKPLPQRLDYFKFPDDYSVFCLGTFDTESGIMCPIPVELEFTISQALK